MNKKGYVSAMEHKPGETADDQLGRVATLVAQAREAGVREMASFFVGVHKAYPGHHQIIMHPEVVGLGRDLLDRLWRGEDIDPAVIFTAMYLNRRLDEELHRVPFKRYQNHVPTLVQIVSPQSLLREFRKLALERLQELHRAGTRLSYEDIVRICEGIRIFKDETSTLVKYFRRLKRRVGRRRAHRRLKRAWTHYRRIITSVDNLQSFEEIEWIMDRWVFLAELPFEEGCNQIFDILVRYERPFPSKHIEPY